MANYIGGQPWPRSITISRKATPEEMAGAGYAAPTGPAGPAAPAGGVGAGVGAGGIDPVTSEALKKAMAFYGPEGGYGKGVEAALGRARTKAVASGTQALVSAGLAGTTMPAGLGKKFEEEIGMPARARVEETRAERLAGFEILKAQITQGATEAARARALQKFLARLSSSTQLQIASMRTAPSIVSRPITPTRTTREDAGAVYARPGEYSSIVGGGIAGGDIRETGGRGGIEFYGFGDQGRETPRAGALENIYRKARTWLDEPMGL